jgi:hypothetical protein
MIRKSLPQGKRKTRKKLIKKERIGSKVIKRYDEAKTPYGRVLASPDIEDEVKVKLKSQYAMLNPAKASKER